MTAREQLAWLKKHALFSCKGCKEDYSKPFNDLRVRDNGEVWCFDCFDSFFYEADQVPDWGTWEQFNPFSEIEKEINKEDVS